MKPWRDRGAVSSGGAMWRGRGRKVRGRAAIGVEKERRDAFGGERVRGREIRGVWEDCERVEEETRRGEGARRGGDRKARWTEMIIAAQSETPVVVKEDSKETVASDGAVKAEKRR